MAALNFVAAEDGLEDDPKLCALGRLLRVSKPTAFWFVLRWQRLILQRGDHLTGSLPKKYNADDIAAFLEFEGDSRRLIDAMKKQGYISFKKGRGFYYPAWKDTTTGRYCCRREEDRLWHERRRKGRATGDTLSDDIARSSSDTSTDHLTTSARDQRGRNQPSAPGVPPDPPPPGGASLADARWEWLTEHAPTPQNREACKRILGTMAEEDWALVQRGYNLRAEPGASISRKNRRALEWPTDQFLRKQAYLRFHVAKRPARTPPRPSPGATSEPLEQIETRLLLADDFVRQLVADPDVPEAKKDEARNRWLADPRNKNRVPPWHPSREGST